MVLQHRDSATKQRHQSLTSMAIALRRIALTTSLGTLAGILACSVTSALDIPDPERFDVSVVVTKPEIVFGDTSYVIVTARNSTRHALVADHNPYHCNAFYEVRDSLGTLLFERPWFCNNIGGPRSIGPGESFSDTIPFDGRGPGSSQSTLPFDSLPSGLYHLRAHISRGLWYPAEPLPVRLTTPEQLSEAPPNTGLELPLR